jgi:DNA-binding MarR family transcriptional regulator
MSNQAAPRQRAAPQHYRGDDYRAEDSIGYLLRLSLSAIRRRLDRQMTLRALTGLQMLPLSAIGQNVCRTAAELARLNDTDPGATSRMLDRLEAKGLVKRVRSAEDRRVVQLQLTEDGQAIAAKIPFALADALNESLRDFSAAEVNTLRRMLRRIIANAEAAE